VGDREIAAFLAQFDIARASVASWPKWMQDAARYAAASLPAETQRSSHTAEPDEKA
jgi:hypothetical protein